MIRYIFAMTTAIVALGLVLLVSILPTPEDNTAGTPPSAASENSFLIRNIRVFDGQSVMENHSIRVEDGKITQMGAQLTAKTNETVIEGEGLTAIPGLIDAHTHTYGGALKDALRFGVTAHLDMFTAEANLQETRTSRDSMEGSLETDLFSSGTMATVAGGHGTQYGFAIDTVDNLEEVPTWITKRKQAGADYIKLVYMPYQNRIPSLDKATATEIIQQAHQQDLKVFAHISTQLAARDMIEAGIYGLVHIFADTLVSDEVVELAAQKQVFIIPTLAVTASVDNQKLGKQLAARPEVAELLSAQQLSTLKAVFGVNIPGFGFDVAKQNVKRFFDAGVPILSGSDAPNSGTAYGVSAHHEMFLLVESGLSPLQALMAATSVPAKMVELEQHGILRIGSPANIVIVKGDPTTNIEHTLNIQHIYKNGYQVERSLSGAASSSDSQKLHTPVLADFEKPQQLTDIDSFMWAPSDDQMANGKSVAILEPTESGANGSRGALQVNASVKPGFPFPWAGAAIGDFEPPIDGFDVSQYSHIVFDVKGTPGKYRVMAFSADVAGIPPSQNFTISEQWQPVTLPLDKFAGFNPKQFSGFAFVAGPEFGESQFVLDNVRFE